MGKPCTVEVYGLIHMNSCIGRLCGMSRVVPPLHCRGVWLQPIHYVQVYGLICMISCIGRFYGTSRVVQPIHLCKCMQYVHECVHRCVHEYVCVCMHVNMNMCIQKQSLMPMNIHVDIYLSAITTPTDKTRAGQGAQGQPARRNGRIYIHIYIYLYISIHIHTYIGQRRSSQILFRLERNFHDFLAYCVSLSSPIDFYLEFTHIKTIGVVFIRKLSKNNTYDC